MLGKAGLERSRRGRKDMDISKSNLTETDEVLPRKISLTRIASLSTAHTNVVNGWEYVAPAKGERYIVYLGKGRVLRTSTVEDIKILEQGILIKTVNSIYRIDYLQSNRDTAEQEEKIDYWRRASESRE
jgi:hypothetical protein